MKKIVITLKISIDNFCVTKGQPVEIYNGGFRHLPGQQPFYPFFGPYHQLHEIADMMLRGSGTEEMHDMFDVKEVDLSLKDEENFRDWVSYCGWTRKAGKWYNAKIKKWLTNVDIFDSYNSTNKSAFRIPIAQAS